MTACVADSPVAADTEAAMGLDKSVFDPLTGELVEWNDRGRLLDLHDRLEGVALEILTACREIRRALAGSSNANRPRLGLYVPLEEQTIPMRRSVRHAQGQQSMRA